MKIARVAERRYASTASVAAALGVSESTIKRWVDSGLLPAQRTVGGHRRLLVADVLRVAKHQDLPRLDLDRLQSRGSRWSRAEVARLRVEVASALRDSSGAVVRIVLMNAVRGGLRLDELADHVIAPAMAQIGHQWQQGRLDVLHEHRATQHCAAALCGIKAELEQAASARGPIAVGGGPEGDPYLLANLLAELVLLAAGWQVIQLGPHTPLVSFRKALIEFRPRLLWLSVSHLTDVKAFRREYTALYKAAERAGVAVALGGQALTAEVRSKMPYTTFGDRLAHLAAFAETLHPRAGAKRSPRRR